MTKIKNEPLQILTIPLSAAFVGWITNKVTGSSWWVTFSWPSWIFLYFRRRDFSLEMQETGLGRGYSLSVSLPPMDISDAWKRERCWKCHQIRVLGPSPPDGVNITRQQTDEGSYSEPYVLK